MNEAEGCNPNESLAHDNWPETIILLLDRD